MAEEVKLMGAEDKFIREFFLVDVFNKYNCEDRKPGDINLSDHKRGEISFQKIESGLYLLAVEVPAYLIEKDGKFYSFDKVTIGTELRIKSNMVMIETPPAVLTKNYAHPCVFYDGTIDYGPLKWFDQLGVKFNHWYKLSNRQKTAKSISQVLKKAKKTLEEINGHYPTVHSIGNLKCLISDTREGAEKYALEKGIALERIIKQY